MNYKFVSELYFHADSMEDAHRKLAEHFTALAEGGCTYLFQEGSFSAIGEPELDLQLQRSGVIEYERQADGTIRPVVPQEIVVQQPK